MNKKILLIILVLLLGTAVFSYRVKIKNFYYDLRKLDLPPEVSLVEMQDSGSKGKIIFTEPAERIITDLRPEDKNYEEINLAVPFTVQAPQADWSLPYKEACEEASILMVVYYLQNKNLDKQVAKTEIDQMVAWQQEHWGGHYDLTIEKTAELVEDYFSGFKTTIVLDLTIDKIKDFLKQGYPVVVPAAGRELDNPFFRTPGPLYHMLVIKGYTDNNFITNDPGTKRGQDFVYDQQALMLAIHDWDGQAPAGGKVGLVITD